jgi:aspartyl-tRNA(Asn)/glutamyl-tRNA(Gln) amidotransferase subunit B
LRYLDVCDGNMEQGSLRCDANVSIRPRGTSTLGTRAEIKNLNSFRFIEQAIEFEVLRQSDLVNRGEKVTQETRLWDAQAQQTRSMRSKEDADDYRYFPDPDLPPLHLEKSWIDGIAESLPELPQKKRARFTSELGLSESDADVLIDDVSLCRFFESAIASHNNAKVIANWVINEVQREARERGLDSFDPEAIGELVGLIDEGTISGKIAKEVFAIMANEGGSPRAIVDERGLKQVTDTGAIESLVDEVLAAHPEVVEQYRAGKTGVVGFLVGQVMKSSGGKANPKLVNELLRSKMTS